MVKSTHVNSEKAAKSADKKPSAPVSQHPQRQDVSPLQELQRGIMPANLRPAHILQLQRSLGNRAVGALLRGAAQVRPTIQAKLMVGLPGDKYEQEADRVAALVMRMPSPSKQEIKPTDRPQVMTKPISQPSGSNGFDPGQAFEQDIAASRGRGQPLPTTLQQEFEAKIGADFSGVRVHIDAQADHLNRSIQAKAFTTGQDVFFRQGAYQPESRRGQELIAHELTHVVQQNGTLLRSPQSLDLRTSDRSIFPSSAPEEAGVIFEDCGLSSYLPVHRSRHCVFAQQKHSEGLIIQRQVFISYGYQPIHPTAMNELNALDAKVPIAELNAMNAYNALLANLANPGYIPSSHQFQYSQKQDPKEWGYCVEEQLDPHALLLGWQRQHVLNGSRIDYSKQLSVLPNVILFADLTTVKQSAPSGRHVEDKLNKAGNKPNNVDWQAADIAHKNLHPAKGAPKLGKPSKITKQQHEMFAEYKKYNATKKDESEFQDDDVTETSVAWNEKMEEIVKYYGPIPGYDFAYEWVDKDRKLFAQKVKTALKGEEHDY